MNIGEKIAQLKENMGFRNYQEFGKFVDLPGDWCLELSKKQEITTVDITRLIKIANKFNVSIDWLVSDSNDDSKDNIEITLADDDIVTLLNNVQSKINEGNAIFQGTAMDRDISKLAVDSIDIIKKLVKQNL